MKCPFVKKVSFLTPSLPKGGGDGGDGDGDGDS